MLDYTDGPTMEDYGYIHEDNLPDLDNLRGHVQGVVDAFYKSGNINDMESGLEEVCAALDMPFAAGAPAVEKRKQNDFMQWFLGYQRCEIDNMTTHRS